LSTETRLAFAYRF